MQLKSAGRGRSGRMLQRKFHCDLWPLLSEGSLFVW